MADPIFVSYFTNDKYKAHADRLAASLRKFGLDFEIDHVPTLGDWLRETHYKPIFVRQKMEKHPFRDVVWIDADCELVASPELLLKVPERAIVAAHYSTLNPEERRMLYNTVVYFRNSKHVREFVVNRWIVENAIHPEDRTDQLNLEAVLEAHDSHPLTWADWLFELPATYCWMEYAMRGPLGADVKPVILHFHEAKARWERK